MNLHELGNRIRARREKCRLKQNDLAGALRVSPQAVSKWERGENAPDISLLAALAKLLSVSIDWLLGGTGEDRDVFEATVFFAGVRNAREMSEAMSPREFAAWANSVCLAVTEAALRQDGVPIKYSGPELLAFFSGAEHNRRAVEAAVSASRTASARLKIGLSTGMIYLGAIGHPDYAQPDIMGETVSLAMLTAGWAASHTASGIAATAKVGNDAAKVFAVGRPRVVEFAGISNKVRVFEIGQPERG